MAGSNGRATRATLADVARQAGVDVSLVSRVIRGKEVSVRPETRERILESARLLGYRPNAIAQSLRSARAGALGLLIPNYENPVYAQIIAGAEAAASDLELILLTASASSLDRRVWRDAIDGGRVEGLLVAGSSPVKLDELRVPHLLVNRADSNRYVALDDSGAARLALSHLVTFGHREVAFVGGPDDSNTAARRASGFLGAAERAQVRAVTLPGDFTAAGGRATMAAALAHGVPMTGVVAANLTSAIGVLEALREAGVAVPADVSVMCIHDAEIAEYLAPTLTTVRMPLHQLGATAVHLLVSTQPNEQVRRTVEAPMQLVVRESTGPARS